MHKAQSPSIASGAEIELYLRIIISDHVELHVANTSNNQHIIVIVSKYQPSLSHRINFSNHIVAPFVMHAVPAAPQARANLSLDVIVYFLSVCL